MIKFKKGLYELNDNVNFNFQFDRLINWDGGSLHDVEKIAHLIKTPKDWSRELIKLGDKVMKEGRTENAIAYYRMSEFFMFDGDPDKLKYYRLAKDLFYNYYHKYFDSGKVEKLFVSYEGVDLPILHVKKENKKGNILVHGGYDSYMEEMFFSMLYLAERGYEVYIFEGPGQGSVLREGKLTFTYKWEKVVSVVLDELELEDVTLIGVSLGGMLAPRAAAFDNRITYVVGLSLFPDFLSVILYDFPPFKKALIKAILKMRCKGLINSIAKKMMKKEPIVEWAITHGMYAMGVNSPYEYIMKLMDFQMIDVADKITQDVLILHGKDDHFIDWRLYKMEIDSLINAKSITLRLFTKEEEASNHCQCGNPKLASDTIISWLETLGN